MRRAVSFALLLAACGDNQRGADVIAVASYAAVPSPRLDLLVQMDNTLVDEQRNLAGFFPPLLDTLATLPGGFPDLHFGVVTSDMGTSGSLDRTLPGPPLGPNCAGLGDDGALQLGGASVTDHYIVDEDDGAGGRRTNYAGTLATTIGQMVQVGANGCGFEQPLAASQRALRNPLNAGFARADATLLVIILADEDDCSIRDPEVLGPPSMVLGTQQSFRCTRFGVTCAEPLEVVGPKSDCRPREDSPYLDGVAPYVDFFRAVRGDPARVGVATLTGPASPFVVEARTLAGIPELGLAHACAYQGANGPNVADPAVRLQAFANGLAPNAAVESVCSQDLSPQMTNIARLVKRMYGVVCLDPSVVGPQPSCSVVTDRASEQTIIPRCTVHPTTDCFEIISDLAACPETSDHLRLAVHLAAPTDDTYVRASCQAWAAGLD